MIVSDYDEELLSKGNQEAETIFLTESDKSIAWKIGKNALSALLSGISFNMIDTLGMIFIGKLDDAIVMSTIGFGNSWLQAFSHSPSYGMATGFSINASHAFGAGNYRDVGILLHKTLIIELLTSVVYSVVAFITEDILLMCGFVPELAKDIGYYAKASIINSFLYGIYMTFWFYLNSQRVVTYLANTSLASIFIHLGVSYFCIIKLEMGLLGAVVSKAITLSIMILLIIYYCIKMHPYPKTWLNFCSESYQGLWKYFKNLMSHGASIYLEMLTFETIAMNIGVLDNVDMLAGHTTALNFIYIMYQFNLNLTIVGSALLGNVVGEGSVEKSKRVTQITTKMILAVWAFMTVFVMITRQYILMIYTEVPGIIDYGSKILFLYCFGYFGDLFTNYLGFILRTIGYEDFVAKLYLGAYYGWGIPMSTILTQVFGLEWFGAWLGILSGALIDAFISWKKVQAIDWERDVEKISKHLKSEKMKQDEEFELM